MDVDALDALLAELRDVKTDHQFIEAKRAQRALPETTHETLSAFANGEGGIFLLGVFENSGTFDVTGVDNPQKMLSEFQAVCASMQPPLRATISLVSHPDGTVLIADIPAVPRDERPCHRAGDGPEKGSFIRVGDGDQRLTPSEVAGMLANRKREDLSRAAAPEGSTLNTVAADAFCQALRNANPKSAEHGNEHLLRQWGVLRDDGTLTYAGLVTLGENPHTRSDSGRIGYRRHPKATDPPDTRFASHNIDGTAGELLDKTLEALNQELGIMQVVRRGQLFDELDIPRETLREVLSNALVHRGFAPSQRDTSVLVEVADSSVVVTSPGGLHVDADLEKLGMTHMSGVRNVSLVRIAEELRSPSGARIVEHQTSGIAAADEACHVAGCMPILFVDKPNAFQVIMLRGTLDLEPARQVLEKKKVEGSPARLRLVSVLLRLMQLREEVNESGLAGVSFGTHLAARSLAPCALVDAAAELRALEDAGILHRLSSKHSSSWRLSNEPAGTGGADRGAGAIEAPAHEQQKPVRDGRSRESRVPELLAAIDASSGGELSPKGIAEALSLASTKSRTRWISEAEKKGFILRTTDNPLSPTSTFRLTDAGRESLLAHRLRQQPTAAQPAPESTGQTR